LSRSELHQKIKNFFADNPITQEAIQTLTAALNKVWKLRESEKEQEIHRLRHKITVLTGSINNQVEAITDPSNAAIKNEIMAAIATKKNELSDFNDRVEEIIHANESDKNQFLRFAFDYIENLGERFLTMSPETRQKCKLVLFPAGFYMDINNNVYTPEISTLYRLATKKKDTEVSENSHLVQVQRLS
jgi:hypothetical protein